LPVAGCLLAALVAACLATPASVRDSPSAIPTAESPASASPAVTAGPTFEPTPTAPATPVPTPRPTLVPTSPPTPPHAPEPTPTPKPGSVPTGPIQTATVVRVVDGDTIVVRTDGRQRRLRYIGVDTPETVDPRQQVEWMAREASAANRALVAGRQVVLEKDVSETDRFGRLLRYVWLRDSRRWTLVNLELVRRGFAHVATYPPDIKYVDLFRAAEAEARNARRGLWASRAAATQRTTSRGTPRPTQERTSGRACDPSDPRVCIPPPPPDLDCPQISYRRFAVIGSDPHRFDGDNDGIGCER
jgi:micrococcal nuclease